ncbi:hypothetical protein NHH03_23515 [Stieleria sp. TO1_6]|uniref:hypothetical protein n=1 Tax=Stieleria tagensis TaxID=2956795 RepID=UPI00209B8586|nr:hypothetical protein [Stieleria tagensis]MCO8124726.1 hypothetical protein [Stieleria tagensis]
MWIRFLSILVVFLCCSLSMWADEKEERDTEDLVYQGIADLTVLRDSVLRRYVLMAKGEVQRIHLTKSGGPPLRIQPAYKLQAVDKSKHFSYLANGRVLDSSATTRGYDLQYWQEFFRCGNMIKGRTGPASALGYTTKKKDQTVKQFIESESLKHTSFQPFDNLITHALFLASPRDQQGWIEQVFLKEGKFLEATKATQGQIVSRWRWKHHSLDFEIEMTQSKVFDYLPVKLKYTSRDKKMPGLFSESEIEWIEHKSTKQFLPHVLKSATGAPFGPTEEHFHWVFDWRIGNEIDDKFFDCESEDFRQQFSPIFDFYFDTYGQPGGILTGTPWKTPEELIDEE